MSKFEETNWIHLDKEGNPFGKKIITMKSTLSLRNKQEEKKCLKNLAERSAELAIRCLLRHDYQAIAKETLYTSCEFLTDMEFSNILEKAIKEYIGYS